MILLRRHKQKMTLTLTVDYTEVSMKNFSYEDIFADCNKQKLVTHKFLEMFKIRNQLVDNNLSDIDPSTSSGVLKISDSLLNCIVHYSFGK